ncbi:MAG: hypothetical protein RIG84_16995 [Roseovarius sp.]
MIRYLRPLHLPLAAVAAHAPAAPAHDRVNGALYRMMEAVCLSPGHSLDARLAVLSEWRAATEEESAQILPAAAEARVSSQVLRGEAEAAARAVLMEDEERHLRTMLEAPSEGAPEAARLLVLKENRGLALLIDVIAAPGIESLGCQLLLRTPEHALLEDLVARYDIMPARADDAAKVWAAETTFFSETQRQVHKRGLVLLLDGRDTRAAVIHTIFTVQDR